MIAALAKTNVTCSTLLLIHGMVHAWVGQKLLKNYIFKSFYDVPKLSLRHCSNEYKCNTTTTPP